MAEEGWDTATGGETNVAPLQVTAELPEVKLFGRWSCDDVEVSDMSLQVCFSSIFLFYFMIKSLKL